MHEDMASGDGTVESNVLLMSSSSLSAAGDLLILSTFALSHEARRLLTVRLIASFAFADLLGQFPIVGSFPIGNMNDWGELWPHGPTFCEVQGFGNWYTAYASWLWTVAYAHAVSSAMPFRRVPLEGWCSEAVRCNFSNREANYHILCWGLPLIVIGSAFAAGLFGRGDNDAEICTFRQSKWALGFYTLLWFAIGYNCWVYVHVLRIASRAVDATSEVLDPATALALARRLDALGGRFMLYLLTFIVSQSPCVLRHLLVVIGQEDVDWMSGLDNACDAICPLHGFLNGLVYGMSNSMLVGALWRGIACRCWTDRLSMRSSRTASRAAQRCTTTQQPQSQGQVQPLVNLVVVERVDILETDERVQAEQHAREPSS